MTTDDGDQEAAGGDAEQGRRPEQRRAVQEDLRVAESTVVQVPAVREGSESRTPAPRRRLENSNSELPWPTDDDDPQPVPRPARRSPGSRRLDLRAKQVVEGFISGHAQEPVLRPVGRVRPAPRVRPRRRHPARRLEGLVARPTSSTSSSTRPRPTSGRTLVVDASASRCSTGRRAPKAGPDKYEYACTAAACLAYLIGQAAGLGRPHHASTADVRQALPPRSSQNHLDAVTKALHVSKPRREDRHPEDHAAGRRDDAAAAGWSSIFSDLLCDREPLFKGLEMLRHRRHDVMVFHVLDDDELTFPFGGMTQVRGAGGAAGPAVRPAGAPRRLPRGAGRVPDEVRRGCTRIGVDYTLVRTSDYLDAVLSRFLYQRMSGAGSRPRSS